MPFIFFSPIFFSIIFLLFIFLSETLLLFLRIRLPVVRRSLHGTNAIGRRGFLGVLLVDGR